MFLRLVKKSLTIGLLASLAAFSGCGDAEDSNGSLVEINAFPNNPKVFRQGFTIDAGDDNFQIDGPWFLMQLSGTNTSDKNLIIISVSAELTSSGDGQTFEWTPDLPDGATFIGAAGPGAPIFWLINASLGGGVQALLAYVDGLPENANGNLNYRVRLTFSGWFTEVADDPETPQNELLIPIESFEKNIILRARRG